MQNASIEYEIIVVDDGSTDMTVEVLMRSRDKFPSLRIISSKVNQGHMNAITEGMRQSRGEYICTIDADLQDPPETILQMLEILRSSTESVNQKIDVVQSFRAERKTDSFFKRSTASLYYKFLKYLTGADIVSNAADFRMLSREAATVLLDLPEKNKVYRLLIPSLGFNVEYVAISREARTLGKSKYTLKKMLKLTVDSIFAFSNRPLHFIAYFGILTSLLLLFSAIVSFFLWLYAQTVPGWTSLILLILSSNALIFASIGVVGEYVGRIYSQNQNRPTGIWREI
jgi:dolichol-phosphate mannosyltransferase